MSADLKIDTATGDIAFENGQLVLIYDDDALIQRLRTRLQDIKGGWFKDTTYGTDWYGSILGKRSDVVRRAEIRRVLVETESVSTVTNLELTFDGTTRGLTIDFTVVKDDGTALDVRFEDVI